MIRLAFIGGIYSNYHALVATLAEIRARGVDETFFLGDLGAFGPFPDRIPERLRADGMRGIQGNYEESLSGGAGDCNCGYTDPRDNHFAQISYDYTFRKTDDDHKRWMGTLPKNLRLEAEGRRLLLSHGSPRRINEFLWRSTSPDAFLLRMCDDYQADVILCTHTGLYWHRPLPGGRHVVNVGAIGRPANDGRTAVWFALLTLGAAVSVEFIPVVYDHHALAAEMRRERLPEEFVETIETGWWTTCLEVLPAKERLRSRF